MLIRIRSGVGGPEQVQHVVPLRRPAIFFWESVGQKQDRTCKHQSICEIVKAIADVSGNGDQDWKIDDEDYKQNCKAKIGCREAGFFVDQQACAASEEDCASEIRPKEADRNPCRSDFCKGDAWSELRMEKMFDAGREIPGSMLCSRIEVFAERQRKRRRLR